MGVYGESLLVVFRLPNGVKLAAFWNGGEVCDVHAINGGFGPLVERWRMTNKKTGRAGINYDVAAFRDLVNWRCADRVAVRQMMAGYRAAMATVPPPAKRAELPPAFSLN